MGTIFKKIYVNEDTEVPDNGEYDTNLGTIEVFCNKWVSDEYIEWYLEEIEIPTEKEIDSMFPLQKGEELMLFNKDVRKGMKWMRNHLLGEDNYA